MAEVELWAVQRHCMIHPREDRGWCAQRFVVPSWASSKLGHAPHTPDHRVFPMRWMANLYCAWRRHR